MKTCKKLTFMLPDKSYFKHLNFVGLKLWINEQNQVLKGVWLRGRK